jgi:serine/threonine protein kinase
VRLGTSAEEHTAIAVRHRTRSTRRVHKVNVGDVIAKSYRLVRRIGAGELGEVWVARHEKIGREVAIKFIVPAWPIGKSSLEAFVRAAKASGRLQVPSIVEMLDSGEMNGVPYVVTALLDAEKLDDLVARKQRLPVGTAVRIVAELAQGMATAHEQRLFHLRIEPANVLLHHPRGKVIPTLIDFGISQLVIDPEHLDRLGPLAYLAPEQIDGGDVDGRADVWALGVLLHHCIVGRTPSSATTRPERSLEIPAEIREQAMAAVAQLTPPDTPLAALVGDAMQPDRTRRPLMKIFARRARDMLKRLPDEWEALRTSLELAEHLESELLMTVMPPKAPPAPARKSSGEMPALADLAADLPDAEPDAVKRR